ncbi:tetratricopeptide repeat protein [Frateuria defendens]|uniref:tetratricopeptide repeat protein n=1 Tax=Frateuria defendens TaxID=2219559 RepID=UPI00066FDBC4|nr:tetratricopeptide repeat protein [Frateuria defendens]
MALMLAACAGVPERGGAGRPAAAAQPLARLTVATPDAAHDLLAQLMAGEMALVGTDLKTAAAHYGQAAALSPDPQVAERATALAVAVHDDAAAQRAIARWQALGAAPVQLAQARAQLALDQGRTEEAQQQLDLLIRHGGADAWRQFGRVLLNARDSAQAGRLLEALATPQRLPADPQAWLAMSEMGDKVGRHAYAMQIADAAVKRFRNAETYAWAAQMRLKSGDSAGAKALLQQSLAKSPDDARLRLSYASLLSQSGDAAGAAKVLDHGLQTPDTYALRVALAVQANDRAALARLYGQLQRAPGKVREGSYFLLGQLAEMLGRKDEALDWYDQVDDDDPHAFDADLRSAVVLHDEGKRADAHALLEQMQTDYLDQPAQLRRAYAADAELYMREQQYPQAAKSFGRALQVTPDDPGLLYGRGLAYAEAGDVDQAVGDLRRLLQLKPGDVDASNALGYTLVDANRDLPEAERLLQTARAAKPNDPAIADSWGWLQYRLGHLDQAEQVLRGAWTANKDADVGVHLGEVLWQRGQRQDAQHVFDEVRRLDPGNASLRATLQRLKP